MGTWQWNAVYDLWLQQTSEILWHTFQISFVEKFKVCQKISEVSCSQSFVFDYIENWKVWKKISENCYDQSFLVSLYLKIVKFDEEIFKFVAIKSFEFDWMQNSKSFIWKSLRSNCDQVFVFDMMQTSKSWIFKKWEKNLCGVQVIKGFDLTDWDHMIWMTIVLSC